MIDSKLQAELRARFSPDGSPLREMQLKLLEILDVVDAVCRKNDIPYWLDSGTLIGAVRHGGFIPWDDDVDIAILHKDKKRFIEACRRDLPENYKLQYFGTDRSYTSNIMKVRNESYPMKEVRHFGKHECPVNGKYRGYFVDVFTEEYSVKSLIWLSKIPVRILSLAQYKWKVGERTLSFLYHFFEFIYTIFRGIVWLNPFKKYLYHTYGSIGFTSRRVMGDIFPLGTISFEGHTYSVPGNCDAYLRRVYGDYMKLPDLTKSIKVHNVALMEKD